MDDNCDSSTPNVPATPPGEDEVKTTDSSTDQAVVNIPKTLYHASPSKNEDAILDYGIIAVKKPIVTLTDNIDQAKKIAERHVRRENDKSLSVFVIDSCAMVHDGVEFEVKDYGYGNVYEVASVPPDYIALKWD